MPTLTTPAGKKLIEATFKKVDSVMQNLYCRWQDEKEHEDIKDYAVAVRPLLPKGVTLLKMTKRPFGFEFNIGTDATYSIFCKASSYGWKRLS